MGSRGIFLLLGLLLLSAELWLMANSQDPPKGTLLSLPRRCNFRPVYGASCDKDVTKYYYNLRHKKCLHFTYGGCGGNQNRFDTLKECDVECRKKDRCALRPSRGYGRQNYYRYYYDLRHKRCLPFTYEGKGGNDNNFEVHEHCDQACHPNTHSHP